MLGAARSVCLNEWVTYLPAPLLALALITAGCGSSAGQTSPAAPASPAASGAPGVTATRAAGPGARPLSIHTAQAGPREPDVVANTMHIDGSLTTDEALIALLEEMGMTEVVALGAGKISFRQADDVVALFRLDDGDLQLYYGIGGVECPLDAINEWNQRYRHSRAYVDHEGDPVIESDLLSDGGVSRHKLRIFVRTFFLSTDKFQALLRQQCKIPVVPRSPSTLSA